MPLIPIQCQNCGARYKIPESFKSSTAKCKACGHVIDVKSQRENPPAPAKESVKESAKGSAKDAAAASAVKSVSTTAAESQAEEDEAAQTEEAERPKPLKRKGSRRSSGKSSRRKAKAEAEDAEGEEEEEESPRRSKRGRSSGRSSRGSSRDKEKKSPAMMIFAIAGIVLILAGGIFFLTKDDNKTSDDDAKAKAEQALAKETAAKAKEAEAAAAAAAEVAAKEAEAAAAKAKAEAEEAKPEKPKKAVKKKPEPEAPDVAQVFDLSTLKPLDWAPEATEEIKLEITELIGRFPGSPTDDRANRRLLIEFDHKALVPLINRLIKLDPKSVEDNLVGNTLCRVIEEITFSAPGFNPAMSAEELSDDIAYSNALCIKYLHENYQSQWSTPDDLEQSRSQEEEEEDE